MKLTRTHKATIIIIGMALTLGALALTVAWKLYLLGLLQAAASQ